MSNNAEKFWKYMFWGATGILPFAIVGAVDVFDTFANTESLWLETLFSVLLPCGIPIFLYFKWQKARKATASNF